MTAEPTRGWNNAREQAAQAMSGNFIKLKRHGDRVDLAIVGEPITFFMHYDGQKYVPYDPAKHDKRSVRHKVNAFNIETKQMQVYEFTAEVMGKLGPEIDLNRLAGSVYRIMRDEESMGGRTTYQVTYLRSLSQEEKEAILHSDLHELTVAQPTERSDGREPPPDDLPPVESYD